MNVSLQTRKLDVRHVSLKAYQYLRGSTTTSFLLRFPTSFLNFYWSVFCSNYAVVVTLKNISGTLKPNIYHISGFTVGLLLQNADNELLP